MHDYDIPDEWQPALKKAEYAFSVLYVGALGEPNAADLAEPLSHGDEDVNPPLIPLSERRQ
jgi:hypothetical protein